MMNDLFTLRWRKPPAPKLYDLACRKCDYQETVRLVDDIVVLHQQADATGAESPRQVESLPKVCPRCGASLKHSKVPVFMQY